jgi:hypothetical protein
MNMMMKISKSNRSSYCINSLYEGRFHERSFIIPSLEAILFLIVWVAFEFKQFCHKRTEEINRILVRFAEMVTVSELSAAAEGMRMSSFFPNKVVMEKCKVFIHFYMCVVLQLKYAAILG